jgi:serine protease Do
MKKIFLAVAVLSFTLIGQLSFAQEDKEVIIEKRIDGKGEKGGKETQEIIIRKKGDKNTKITVEINGDKVLINGKPLSEFKDGDITINKRNIHIWDGQNNMSFDPEDIEMYFNNGTMNRAGGSKAFLGVSTKSTDEEDDTKAAEGATITSVTKGSAAEKAGLKEGDIIKKINDKKVESADALSDVIDDFKPKDEVTVYYQRNGKDMSTKATLGQTQRSMSFSFSGPRGNFRSFSMPRMQQPPVAPMPNFNWNQDFNSFDKLRDIYMFPRQQKLGIKIQDTEDGKGVKILDAEKDSPAEKAGLQKDDVITAIGGKAVNNTDDAREQLQDNADKAAYTIKVMRNGKEITVDIKIPKKLKTANL